MQDLVIAQPPRSPGSITAVYLPYFPYLLFRGSQRKTEIFCRFFKILPHMNASQQNMSTPPQEPTPNVYPNTTLLDAAQTTLSSPGQASSCCRESTGAFRANGCPQPHLLGEASGDGARADTPPRKAVRVTRSYPIPDEAIHAPRPVIVPAGGSYQSRRSRGRYTDSETACPM